MTAPTVDVDAYLRRLGLDGESGTLGATGAGLARMHRAHLAAIVYENLDPLRGTPVSLELPALQDKLVTGRRGGYCFEHNLLFAAVARELGFTVTPMLGRVGGRDEATRARTHVVLRIRDRDGTDWQADVGFGVGWRAGAPTEPLPFDSAEEHEQEGWRFRCEHHGRELVMVNLSSDGEWVDMYSFDPEPVPMVDMETSNWWAATHPTRSRFTRYLVVSHHQGPRRTLLTDATGELTFTELTPAGRAQTAVTAPEVPGLLADRFGLGAWAYGPDGRLAPCLS